MGFFNLPYLYPIKISIKKKKKIINTSIIKNSSSTAMASISINASMQRACSSLHVINKQGSPPPARSVRSFVANQATNVISSNIQWPKRPETAEDNSHQKHTVPINRVESEKKQNEETKSSVKKFFDERWKNGTWDLNMFVKAGRMDWDGVIVAEAKRRKFLQVNPGVSTNEDPVRFRTSIVPWWAWITHSHLPEAELLNGRAAMVGFFMAYVVDCLTGMNVVGQTGNFICKAGLFLTIVGILAFRRSDDIEKLKNLADEATFYDKQWQASWKDQDISNGA